MFEPRHPLTSEAIRVIEEADAYFAPEKSKAPAKPVPDLSPLEQMFAYYD